MTTNRITIKGGLQPVTFRVHTGQPAEVTVTNTVIRVLEMEDVLFHHDSAVMMPARPSGSSSADGAEDDATNAGDRQIRQQQEQASGLDALALVFRQSEFYPEQRILIAGHTDTSGSYELNYTLSELRAKNVLYLLLGSDPAAKEPAEEGEAWAAICSERHKIEDYKQILTHFVMRGDLPASCDPHGMTDAWNSDTEAACNAFFDERIADPARAAEIKRQVRADSRHRWPVEAWKAVYELYATQLRRTLNVNPEQFRAKRDALVTKFSIDHLYVACGESYPIENSQKNNYRSQKNRRVEILFVEEEALANIRCPTARNRKHRTRLDTPPPAIECPIWHQFIEQDYIDPNDLYAVAYHLKFSYYDKIKKQRIAVPDGMRFRSYKKDNTEIPSRQFYKNGVYCVVVQFRSQEESDAHANEIYFSSQNAEKWIYTENDLADTLPVVVENVSKSVWETLSDSNRKGKCCIETLSPVQRFHYYDLPPEWDSRNWPCMVGGKADVFSAHMSKRTTKEAPIEFNLDTLVLLETNGGTQAIQDEDHFGNPKPCSATHSRIKIIYHDLNTGEIALFKRGTEDFTARIPFGRNLITENCENILVVLFKNGFYPVASRRTHPETNWVTQNFVVGARAAIRNDPDCIVLSPMQHKQNYMSYTGDYDVIYGHHLSFYDGHPISLYIIYVSISFMRDSRWADGDTNPEHNVPSLAAVRKFIDEGCYLSMARYNSKKYYLEEDPAAVDGTRIIPFYLFDERETFNVDDATRPTGIDFDTDAGKPVLMAHPAVTTARTNAYGGKSKFLAMICRDSSATSQYGLAYHHAVRNSTNLPYSLFKLNESAYHGVTGPFHPVMPYIEDGVSYQVFTMAHELGHATGHADEYLRNNFKVGDENFPTFYQFFECYNMAWNRPSLMYWNGAPRLHHLAYVLNHIHHQITAGEFKSKNWLQGKKFVAVYNFATGSYRYSRQQSGLTIPSDPRVAMHVNGRLEVRGSNPRKTVYTALYYVSQDESSCRRFHPGQAIEYQAVLVVRVLLSVNFSWLTSTENRANRLREIDDQWSALSCKYRLVNGTGHIKNIIIHFLMGFTEEQETATRNYRADISWWSHGDRIVSAGGTSDEITIRRHATGEDVVAYFLDIRNTADLTQTSAMVNHLDFLRRWVNNRLSDNMVLEHI